MNRRKRRSNCSVTLMLTVGVGVLFFSQLLSGGGGGRRVHWWKWRCVCAYRGSLIHNQLQRARCTARRVHRRRWRWPCRSRVAAGACSAPWFACSLSLSHFPSPSLPLSFSLLSPARSRWVLTVRSLSLPLRAGTIECLPSAASAHPPPHFPKYKEVEHQGPR